jgi:hypothetical protein
VDAAEAIDLFGWRQGAFLPEILRPKLTGGVGANLSPSDTVICVTQSCDVIHGDFEAEPSAEFAALRKVDPDPAVQWGRHPRRLQVELKVKGVAACYELRPHQRFSLPRELLAEVGPDQGVEISVTDMAQIARWLGKRYTRPALPTAFNLRLRPQQDQIRRVMRSGHRLLSDFLIRIDFYDELPADRPYTADLLLVAHDTHASSPDLQNLSRDLRSAFNQCSGVHLRDVDILAESRTSLKLARSYVPWDFDDFSLREGIEPKPAP